VREEVASESQNDDGRRGTWIAHRARLYQQIPSYCPASSPFTRAAPTRSTRI
jgi:hypothetical protein